MLTLTQVSTTLPVSLADVKTFLKVDGTEQDTEITSFIWQAVEDVENQCDIDLRAKTYELVRPGFLYSYDLARPVHLPHCHRYVVLRRPTTSILGITYYDTSNALQTLDTEQYALFSPVDLPGRVYPVDVWPAHYHRCDAVKISFVAGYTAQNLPYAARALILLSVGGFYEYRASEGEKPTTANKAYERLINQVRGVML